MDQSLGVIYLYILFISANHLLIQKCYSLVNAVLHNNAINVTCIAEESYPITKLQCAYLRHCKYFCLCKLCHFVKQSRDCA